MAWRESPLVEKIQISECEWRGKGEGVATVVVDIVFAFGYVGAESGAPDFRGFTHSTEAFR